MIKYFSIIANKIVQSDNLNNDIIIFIAPDASEYKLLIDTYELDEHTIQSALDPDEVSRIQIEDNYTGIFLKSPKNYSKNDDLIFKLLSMGLFYTAKRLIIILPEEIEIFEGRQILKIFSVRDVVLKIIYGSINHFLGHLKVIDMISSSLENKINDKMENRFLINMFKIEKSLVYYINAINSNAMLLEKMRLNTLKLGFNEENIELLEDCIIENNQCSKQASIYENVISGLMQTRGSIVNNNLNLLIKRLTILSVVFMPLNLLAGIGGMSEFSLLTSKFKWFYSYGSLVLFMLFLAFFTFFILKWFLDRNDL